MKTQEEIIKKLGSVWEKCGMRRVYFNDLPRWFGLDVARYGTGNISSARLNGRTISNSEAKRIMFRLLETKIWYDLNDGKFRGQGDPEAFRIIVERIQQAVAEAEQAA